MLHILFYFLILVSYAFVPGMAVLYLVRFRSRRWADAVIACFWTGMAWTVFWVFLLLFCGLYYRLTALAVLGVPLIGIAWMSRQRLAERRSDRRERPRQFVSTIAGLDLAVVSAVAIFLLLCWIDAASSPFTGWDAAVSWDKWACDWGRRHSLWGYLVGAYPQAGPMFYSVLYKLTGTSAEPLSHPQFAAHAFQPVIAAILLLTIYRLACLCRVAPWGVMLTVFGSAALRQRIGSGDADLLLTAAMAGSIVVYIGYSARAWTTKHGVSVVLAAVLFVATFTKVNGLFAPLFVLALAACDRRCEEGNSADDAPESENKGELPPQLEVVQRHSPRLRDLSFALLIPILVSGSFYVEQIASAITLSPSQLNTREVNFNPLRMPEILRATADSTFAGHGPLTRLWGATRRLVGSYDLLGPLSVPALILAGLALVVCIRRQRLGVLVLVCAGGFLVWVRWASYDVRNFLPFVPILGLCACAGLGGLLDAAAKHTAIRALLVLCVATVGTNLGFSLMRENLTLASMFRGDPSAFARRMDTIKGGMDERVALYFPRQSPTYAFLRSLPMARRATSLFATDPMYRWFATGIYTLCAGERKYLPGDLYVSAEPNPSMDVRWTMIQDEVYRVWLNEVSPRKVPLSRLLLTGKTPPRMKDLSAAGLNLELDGSSGLIMYNLEDRKLLGGSAVVWSAVVAGSVPNPEIRPSYESYDPEILDTSRTRVAVDTSRSKQGLLTYSGILTFSGKPLAADLNRRILVGIESSQDAGALRILDFQYSTYDADNLHDASWPKRTMASESPVAVASSQREGDQPPTVIIPTLAPEPYDDHRGHNFTVSWLGKETEFIVRNPGRESQALLTARVATFGKPHTAELIRDGRPIGKAALVKQVFWIDGADTVRFPLRLLPGENRFTLRSKESPNELPGGRQVCFLLIGEPQLQANGK